METTGNKVPFLEAIRAMQQRGVVLPDVYYGQLQGIARQLSFSIAGVASFDQLQAVKDSLTKAMQNGETFAQWQKNLSVQELGLPKHRLDNIFRTNIQSQYMAGKWEQFERHQDSRPYLMYDAINDARVRPTHLALDGIIRPLNDPFWRVHSCPNGYRCRCNLISLTEKQAQARSGVGKGLNKAVDEEKMQPDKGWDYSPRDRLAGINQAIDKRMEKGGILAQELTKTLSQAQVLKEEFIQAFLAEQQQANQGMLLSKLNNTLISSPEMNIIPLESLTLVQKTLTELATKKPDWFPEGFKGIHAVDRADMFAGYQQGIFYFSNADTLISGFKPASELAGAFEKIHSGTALTFNEEYAVETLWHEMLHARALHLEFPKNKNAVLSIEAIHQWQSRRTYQDLLLALESKAVHQGKILHSGLAYQTEVINFNVLLELMKLKDDRELINTVQVIWLSGIPVQQAKEKVVQGLAEKSGLKESRIAKSLNYLSERQGDFKAKAQRIFSY